MSQALPADLLVRRLQKFSRVAFAGLVLVSLVWLFQGGEPEGVSAVLWTAIAGLLFLAAQWPAKTIQAKKALVLSWCAFVWCWLLLAWVLSDVIKHFPPDYAGFYQDWPYSRRIYKLSCFLCLPLFMGLSLDLGKSGYSWGQTRTGFWLGLGLGPAEAGFYAFSPFWQVFFPSLLLWVFAQLLEKQFFKPGDFLNFAKAWFWLNIIAFVEPFFALWGLPAWAGPALRLAVMAFLLAPRSLALPQKGLAYATALGLALWLKSQGLNQGWHALFLVFGALTLVWLAWRFTKKNSQYFLGSLLAWLGLNSLGGQLGILFKPWPREALWMPLLLSSLLWKE